jgi:hypothetical protein
MTTTPKLGAYNYRFGAIAACVSIVFSLVVYFFDFDYSLTVKATPLITTSVVTILAIYAFRRSEKNKISLNQAIRVGVGVFLICAILYQVYLFAFLKLTHDTPAQLTESFFKDLPPFLVKNILSGMIVGTVTGIFAKKS